MKYVTMNEISQLRTILENKRSRIRNLTRMLQENPSKELLSWATKEIQDGETWCARAEKTIRDFYGVGAQVA